MRILVLGGTTLVESVSPILNEQLLPDIVQTNNLDDAIALCKNHKYNDKFDLIIMPMKFARAKPLSETTYVVHPNAGCMLLAYLARENYNIPVIIFSPDENYLQEYKTFLFPAFDTFCEKFDSHPCFIEGSEVGKVFDKIIAESQTILDSTTFVLGQANNQGEFAQLLKELFQKD